MPLPQKQYFALAEVERRWGMQRPDTVYFAENGRIEVSIRAHDLDVEEGVAAHPKAPWGRSAERRFRLWLGGRVHLVQRRISGGFAYLAIARRVRSTSPKLFRS